MSKIKELVSKIVVLAPCPPWELWPNSRPHRMAKAAATKKYRTWAWACTLEAMGKAGLESPRWAQAMVSVHYYHPTCRLRDRDNIQAALKAAFDALADAKLIGNDSGLVHMPVMRSIDRQNPRVEITVERL